MTSSEGFSSNKAPLFDGTNYSFWKFIMKTYLSALGYEIWEATKNGYTTPSMLIQLQLIGRHMKVTQRPRMPLCAVWWIES